MSAKVLELQALSDVAPASNRERGYFTPAYPFIPGGSLRGALAAHWIRINGKPESDPERFEAEIRALRIGPAIAEGSSQRPLSVFACKYPKQPACHQTFDAAFDELPADLVCPGCQSRLEGSKGQWAGVRRRTRTRTALDVDGTPKAGSLFSRASLALGQTFRARVSGDTSWLKGDFTVRVGGERSTAGRMTCNIKDEEAVALPAQGETLVVRLVGPAVFVAADGRTRLEPQPGDLARALRGTDAPVDQIVVSERWVRPETFGGWNAAGGLPKSTEVVAAPGSTYVLRLPAGKVWQEAWMIALRDAGLGLRRADGLGWIEIPSSAWKQPKSESEAAAPAAPDSGVAQALARVAGVNDRGFLRQVIGWLGEGYTDTLHPPGYAYEGLSGDAQARANSALAISDEERRRVLIIALTARYHRASLKADKERA